MYRFIIPIDLQPGKRDEILARVPGAGGDPRRAGVRAYDFYTCTDDHDRPEAMTSTCSISTPEMDRLHEPKHRSFLFETIDAAP